MPGEQTNTENSQSSPTSGAPKVASDTKRKLRLSNKKKALLLLTILVIFGATLAVLRYLDSKGSNSYVETQTDLTIEDVNRALVANDTARAYELAKKALEQSPDDLYTIEMTAGIAKSIDAEESKRLYARALEVFKKNDNPDEEGKKATTYIAAGGLAENAGLIDQAKLYYQKVIASSDPNDQLNRVIILDAEERLKRLP